MSLYEKTASSIKWSLIDTVGNMGIQFVVGIILARILMPSDFGLLAMCIVFISVSRSLIDSGLYQALIQKYTINKGDISSVFKFNLIVSVCLFFLVIVSAKSISSFFKEPLIQKLLYALSFIILFDAVSIIQRALIIKQLKFGLFARIQIISKLIASGTGIFFALNGFGVWSLVIKEIATSILVSGSFWLINPIKIKIREKANDFKKLWGFGWRIFFADQIENFSNQLASIIIGKKYTSSDLGYYQRAELFQGIILTTIVTSVNRVIFPSLSSIQDDIEKLKLGYRIINILIMFILLPTLIAAIQIADIFIPLFLGEKWSPSVEYFQILCLGGLAFPFTVLNLNMLKVRGYAKKYFNISLFSKGLLIPAVILGLIFHIKGLIIALIIQKIIAVVINSHYSGEVVNYSLLDQLNDIKYMILIAILIFVSIFLLKLHLYHIFTSKFISIIVLTFIVYAMFFLMVYVFNKENFSLARKIIVDIIK